MKSYLTDFNEISKALAEQDRAQAVHDFNNELAGREVGRISRFLGDHAAETVSNRRRGKDAGDDALDFALIAQQSYEALLNDTWDRLRDAETAAERALQRAQDELTASTATLQTTLDRAATLEDGTRVFRDDAGQVWTERHEAVGPILAASIEWQGYEPSYETFTVREGAVADDQQRIDIIHGHQVTLGGYRERLSDDENPPTREELDEIGEGIDQIMLDIAPAEINDQELAIQERTAGISLPTLGD